MGSLKCHRHIDHETSTFLRIDFTGYNVSGGFTDQLNETLVTTKSLNLFTHYTSIHNPDQRPLDRHIPLF